MEPVTLKEKEFIREQCTLVGNVAFHRSIVNSGSVLEVNS